VQILLYMLKLDLPEPLSLPIPRPLPSSRVTKRPRLQPPTTDEDSTPRAILEDRLESLMDRLMLWQMTLPDPEENKDDDGLSKPIRDWTQVFCDDVVQPL
jgi:hypothetical protein